MTSHKNSSIIRWIIIGLSFIIVALILWNTYMFFQNFKLEERTKMEILASAQKELTNNIDLNAGINLPLKIIENNKTIPMIWTTDMDEIINFHNLDSVKSLRPGYLEKQLRIMKSQNSPIAINIDTSDGVIKQYIYYRDSDLLTRLKYYPLALILILVLFTAVIYLFFKSNKIAEQNKLWTGMAKETAHQIGTPLSSLLGWIEILRMEDTDTNTLNEIEKDVHRLNTIAERFSKIGSIPVLKNQNLIALTQSSFQYLASRSSKHVRFNFLSALKTVNVNVNKQLFGWVIENLVKNAIDAMEGKGAVTLEVIESEKQVVLSIHDTGKGIPKSLHQKIFTPGFTTKKRGWGLGLSLAKRIIEDYHNGKIFVAKSDQKTGTIFKIMLFK